MSTRRLAMIKAVPMSVKNVFRTAEEASTPEERLWRERAARMTLDALGYTNLTVKPWEHNEAVRYARRWFRGMFEDGPDSDSATATFDSASVLFVTVRDAVLAETPVILEEPDREQVSS